jgi:hypothetical protein
MSHSARHFLLVAAISLALLGSAPAPPADESAEAMDARLAAAAVTRVGPSYLYPDHATTPGLVNPDVTQDTIHQTICTRGWTATIRPPVGYTNTLKREQLAGTTDRNPSHFEEDHFISLELGGHPHDPRNLWPERWGTPDHPLTAQGPFPSHLVGAKNKDAVENALHREVCAGRMTLREAQWVISQDWFKYFRERVLR